MNPASTYILDQVEPFRSVLLHLQSVIEATVPEVDLKFKYRIPFYYIDKRPFCYLNCTKAYVDLGFWNATHLTVHEDRLTTAGRKVMRSLRYCSLEEIDDQILIAVLLDAYRVKDGKNAKH